MATKNMISDDVWDEQADILELGLKHANQIARELGVSPQTVSRQMKRRGAVKGSRVNASIEDLVIALDRRTRCAALLELSDSQRRQEVVEANAKAIGYMVAALLEADRRGDLKLAAPVIDSLGAALGGKRRRRSRS